MADGYLNADAAFVFLTDVYTRDGADPAVQAHHDRGRGRLYRAAGPERRVRS
jgi:hypothetical protein